MKIEEDGYCVSSNIVHKHKPGCIWIAPQTKQSESYMLDDIAMFASEAAEEQELHGRHFVIAHPWYSDFWEHEWILHLLSYDNVQYQKIDMATYDRKYKSKTYMCLMHNLPGDSGKLLKAGSVRPNERGRKRWFSDDYPNAFCELVQEVVMDALQIPQEQEPAWPAQSPIQMALMTSLLEPLEPEDVKALDKMIVDEELPG